MTYDQILTLDSIVKYGSFKSAAEVMHKSQPSLSVAIKKLEEEFNIELFNRDGYRPELTETGRAFHKKALKALESFKELENLGQQLGAGFESQIKICADAVFPIVKISHIFQKFFDPHISTTLDLNTDVLDGVVSKLNSQEVDFALGPDYELGSHIEKVKILEVNMLPVIAPKYEDMCNIKLLKKLPQIVVGSSVKEKRSQVHGAVSDQFWYTSDFSMKEQLIESGLGWGRLPLHQIKSKIENKKLLEIHNVGEVQSQCVSMFLLRNKEKIMGPNTRNLWTYLSQIGLKNDPN